MKVMMSQLTLYEAEEFQRSVLAAVKRVKKQFTLDLAKVEKIDFCGVQLLLSLQKYCRDESIALRFTNVKAVKVRQAFSMLNLSMESSS